MKKITLLLLLLLSSNLHAKHKIKVYTEKGKDGSYLIYADNAELCKMSLEIKFKTTNLRIKGGNNKTYILQANKKRQLLTVLSPINKKAARKFSSKTKSSWGDYKTNIIRTNYIYDLPYATKNEFKLSQGYNGDFSHTGKNQLDFSMPIGSEIVAARSGIVVQMTDNNTKTCAKIECADYNNSIMIAHDDGTFANYEHIDTNGSFVKVGDKVLKGDKIARSGNIGFSSGPHLHFDVFAPGKGERRTLRTKFRLGGGKAPNFLEQGLKYLRDY